MKKLTNFYETWYGHYNTRDHAVSVLDNLLPPITPTQCPWELLRQEKH